MRTTAKLLFSITILLASAAPALATGGRNDSGMAAEALNPKLAEFYNYRGTMYYHMDKYDAAITDYDLAIKLRRNYADAYYNRGMALDGKGLLQRALSDLRKALTCSAFSLSANTWADAVRAKIIEIEAKLSESASLQAQSSDAAVQDTIVK
jgi:lipoprotein NlpI